MTEENGKITIKQELLIAALIAGQTILAASKVAGISEKSAHTYLKMPHVAAEYKRQKKLVFDEALEGLMKDVDAAIRTVKLLTLDKEVQPQVRLRAAQIWIELSVQHNEVRELHDMFTEVQQYIKQKDR